MKPRMTSVKTVVIFFVLASFLHCAFSKPTRRYRYDAEFLDSEIQRIRSGRAEDIEPVWARATVTKEPAKVSVPVPVQPQSTSDNNGDDNGDDNDNSSSTESEGDDDENEDYYGSSEEIDVTCAPHKGWHIRGQRCVPLNCPGGPAERDFNTGECLYSQSSGGRLVKPFQQWNDLNHVYRSSPMSSHFVRSMILMRKG